MNTCECNKKKNNNIKGKLFHKNKDTLKYEHYVQSEVLVNSTKVKSNTHII